MAELAELSINAISSFERGLRFPRPKSLDALARALGAEPGDFMVESTAGTSERGALADLVSLLSRATPDTVELVLDLAKVLVSRDRRRADPALVASAATASSAAALAPTPAADTAAHATEPAEAHPERPRDS